MQWPMALGQPTTLSIDNDKPFGSSVVHHGCHGRDSEDMGKKCKESLEKHIMNAASVTSASVSLCREELLGIAGRYENLKSLNCKREVQVPFANETISLVFSDLSLDMEFLIKAAVKTRALNTESGLLPLPWETWVFAQQAQKCPVEEGLLQDMNRARACATSPFQRDDLGLLFWQVSFSNYCYCRARNYYQILCVNSVCLNCETKPPRLAKFSRFLVNVSHLLPNYSQFLTIPSHA